jgi:thiol-disulfide isomerase/thioredoxin
MGQWILFLFLALVLPSSNASMVQQRRTLVEIDSQGLARVVSGQKGKVVFVNFWATWCAPCVAEFPDIVSLYRKYHAKGLEVVTVSFDMEAATATSFLDRQKADFLNLWKSPKLDDNEFMKGFDQECVGALPLSWLFDQKGRRIYFRMGKFETAAVDKYIADLLAAPKEEFHPMKE